MQPIPWLTWNNRPYVSQLELTLVPSSAPWRLPYEMRRVGTALTDIGDRQDDFLAPWGHLINFFFEDPDGPDPNFNVVLDWLEVPSRFVGTQKWLSPQLNYTQQMTDLQGLGPPFNKLSRFRDPGKINLNTIPGAIVWQAVDPFATAADWSAVQQSLAGDQSIAERPAYYGNPLRAAASADLMPLDDLETSQAEATLFRSYPGDEKSLLFNPSGTAEWVANPERNAYFQYHKLQRLGNLLTSHSNVYAVWITVGYFEVYPWNGADPNNLALSRSNPAAVTPFPDAAHPDGYQLGPELGSDSGHTKRHRGFYIIDRSIPVGYKNGQDVNADRTIVLRRFIE
jgi:hypothetical protein